MSDKWLKGQLAKCRQDVTSLVCKIRTLKLILKHPRAPWHAKVVAGCAVAYLVSPIQVIPTFIPIIGQLDDIAVLYLAIRVIRRITPAWILATCQEEAKSKTVVTRVENSYVVIPRSSMRAA